MYKFLRNYHTKTFKVISIFAVLTFASSCSEFLTISDEYSCEDSKGTVDDFVLDIQRSFFANSNLMKIPSKANALKVSRTICSENDEILVAGNDCRGDDNDKRSLIFNKETGQLEIYVSPTIIRRAICKPII